ncbi:very long chain fatty acid elongase AAEL008004 [Anabrus simplex]|uniref:very long chain fatty acid elongase AAEL008004 n=1 Tax=Anabrus simplex TaxID=316456 RepID=UPI0034DD3F8F
MSFIAQLEQSFKKNRDPRVAEWFLNRDPSLPILLLTSYILFVFWLGPRFMKDRKPFKLTNVLMVYNLIQIVFNAMMFVMLMDAGWFGHYSFICEPVDYSNTPHAMKMPRVAWWYLLFKMVDLLDTVFFVLRKKFNQVTFLHVYHHTIMVVYIWVGINIWPGGHGSFFAVLNTFVHVVMYSYYFLAGLGPQYQKYLWWKKYVTKIQLVQFALVMVHAMQLLWVDCGYPRQLAYLLLANAVIFMGLFLNFYVKSYTSSKASRIKREN